MPPNHPDHPAGMPPLVPIEALDNAQNSLRSRSSLLREIEQYRSREQPTNLSIEFDAIDDKAAGLPQNFTGRGGQQQKKRNQNWNYQNRNNRPMNNNHNNNYNR